MIVLFRTRKINGVEGAEQYFTGKFNEDGRPRITKNPRLAFGFKNRRQAYEYAARLDFETWRVGERS